ncbi:sodium-dependent bicarbonate transport family permease [Pelagicoccus sp. NFK12]|uniref:Sodium-dependent bicarbonate transport family permease n=1 Tax=Pelagicoccus enzymogenes TaxID=2773457 RepID=A0A927FB29_9BACT|nr:sodium-dependent bicarbonate transport family permease [Pelagicoccus enzymogenes]MBD5781144.1 sodium-dependent bicarbonate transport family permease [Pelagicoccus enzymogenes]
MLLPIGFKGGASIAETSFLTVAPVALGAIALGAFLSIAAFYVSKELIFKSASDAAAARIALPEANPAYCLFTSLGITFPFNLAIGIPLY